MKYATIILIRLNSMYVLSHHNARLYYCAYAIAVCSVFNIMLRVLVFYQKQNV